MSSRGGGVMVSVLAIEPKIRGFKPGGGDTFLRAIKVSSTLPAKKYAIVPCLKTLQLVKKTLRNKTLRKANS
jgi:hypothetical protein